MGDSIPIVIKAELEIPYLYIILLKKILNKLEEDNTFIPYYDYYSFCSWFFRLNKHDAKIILKELRDADLIKVTRRGIEIKCSI